MNNDEKGLTTKEAKSRLRQYGENVIYHKRRSRPFVTFIRKFTSPLLLILIFASLLSFFVGEHTNAAIILTIIVVSGLLDSTNTLKAQNAIDKLVGKVTSTARVVRDGKEKEIPLRDVVPGDLISLSAGDIVPADCRVLEAENLFVNQAALTGESFPVEKSAAAADKKNLIYLGTSVVTGIAKARAEQTGLNTEFGRVAAELEAPPPETDFEKNLKSFSFFMLRLTFVLVSFVFLANALLGHGILESFIFAIAIAVGLTPELLPIIMSVSLSSGAIAMARKDVIVKNLSSIESFGSMDILCTDKTGTLTQNKIVLVKYVDGYGNSSDSTLLHTYLSGMFHTGVKDIFDHAIREYKKLDITGYKKVVEIPFDFERRRDSIVVSYQGKNTLITKGAPEDIMKISRLDAATVENSKRRLWR